MPAAASPRQVRRSGVILPEDPSDEELARNWTLSESDQREVLLCRGEENRRRFALQLPVCCGGDVAIAGTGGNGTVVRVANAMLERSSLCGRRSRLWVESGERRRKRMYAERIRRHFGLRPVSPSRPAARTCQLGGRAHSGRHVVWSSGGSDTTSRALAPRAMRPCCRVARCGLPR